MSKHDRTQSESEEMETAQDCLSDDWRVYDNCAAWCARKGFTGAIGDPLPLNLSTGVLRLINADPEAFQTRVRHFAYALAMGE